MTAEGDAGGYRDTAPFSVEAASHRFRFHPEGQERLQALLEMIAGAQERIEMCFYIFSDDVSGKLVRDALVAAAGRGVAATLIVDGFGTPTPDSFFAPFVEAGGTFLRFSKSYGRRYLIRNHQKMVIADRKRGLTGGFNIDDDYFACPDENGWNDLAVSMEGPVVGQLCAWFEWLEQWIANPGGRWRAVRRKVRQWDPGDGKVQLLVGGPARGMSPWVRSLAHDLDAAKRLAVMIAYFSPSRGLLHRMRRVASRGSALFLLPACSDNSTTIAASRFLYRKLLARGARIFEFTPCKMHTKLIVADDALYVGSANLDMRSLFINLELMIRIEDKALADRIAGYIEDHCRHADPITPDVYDSLDRPWNRLRWFLSYLLVGVLDYTVSRRLNFRTGG